MVEEEAEVQSNCELSKGMLGEYVAELDGFLNLHPVSLQHGVQCWEKRTVGSEFVPELEFILDLSSSIIL